MGSMWKQNLSAARCAAIERERSVRVVTSFLGAHAVPKGADADFYIDKVCIPALEAAHKEGLVDAVDGFCEGIALILSDRGVFLRERGSLISQSNYTPSSFPTLVVPSWRQVTMRYL